MDRKCGSRLCSDYQCLLVLRSEFADFLSSVLVVVDALCQLRLNWLLLERKERETAWMGICVESSELVCVGVV